MTTKANAAKKVTGTKAKAAKAPMKKGGKAKAAAAASKLAVVPAPKTPHQLLLELFPKGIPTAEYPKLVKAMTEAMKPTKEVYTVLEISELLRVTRATVQVWIGEGKLEGKRDGWKFLVPRASLETFLASTGRDVSVLQ